MSDLLRMTGLSLRYGGFLALDDVTLGFPEGRLTAVIGPNGAGKSSLFEILAGSLKPSRGKLFFRGEDITGRPSHMFPRLGIARSFQMSSLFRDLSARDNLAVAIEARERSISFWGNRSPPAKRNDRIDAILDDVLLFDQRDRMAHSLSHGEQRALDIAIALACDPQVLLLDEPTAGMSPEESLHMRHLVLRLAASRTVLMVEHKMAMVTGICDRIVVLHQGRVLASGTPEIIMGDARVREVYLGQGLYQGPPQPTPQPTNARHAAS